ncbi:MAG TPA: SagB/ThcOx family dehydrogenase [Deltaproteobacteria bacterium]|nr:SagB/ThcOx family dehydrogenase [Deltaproteobacteria bacterium]
MSGSAIRERRQERMGRREALRAMGGFMACLPVWFLAVHFPSVLPVLAGTGKEARMKLPKPRLDGSLSVEKAISVRRTVRSFSPKTLTLEQLSQILWSAQGITDPRGFKRASPSAGALYPLELFAVVGHDGVVDLGAGIYHHEPREHAMSLVAEGDHREELARASLSQFWMAKAPLSIVICAEYHRITGKYGTRGERYAVIESGHMAQNIFLQSLALGLEAAVVGAFTNAEVRRVIRARTGIDPLLVMPVGYGKG